MYIMCGHAFYTKWCPGKVDAASESGDCGQCSGEGWPAFERGDAATVLYRRDDPSVGYIDSFTDQWFIQGFFGTIGATFLVAGIRLRTVIRRLPTLSRRIDSRPSDSGFLLPSHIRAITLTFGRARNGR
jgi:hypothetical protein